MRTHMRIQMIESKRVEKPGGGPQEFLMGRFYLIPTKQAREWIAEGVAADPDAPPTVEEPAAPAEEVPVEPVAETEKAGEG